MQLYIGASNVRRPIPFFTEWMPVNSYGRNSNSIFDGPNSKPEVISDPLLFIYSISESSVDFSWQFPMLNLERIRLFANLQS